MLQPAVQPAPCRRRGYQDYGSCLNFFTAAHWRDIAATPQLTPEIVVAFLSSLKLELPKEQTSADVAAIIAVAQFGAVRSMSLMPEHLNGIFDRFKAH